jgi:hypothetical protein
MAVKKLTDSEKNVVVNGREQQHKIIQPEKIPYSVAHAIPGRIRFRISRLAKDSEYAKKLQRLVESDARTTNVRINPAAASIVIEYQSKLVSGAQMRSHLIDLIQTAPSVVLPSPVTIRSIAKTLFDAVLNLIDGTRNLNKARTAIKHKEVKTNTWERLLSSTKTIVKGLKSAIMFILPNKQLRLSSNPKLAWNH